MSSLPFSPSLAIRWFVVKCVLLAAAALAWALRLLPKLRVPRAGAIALPQDDPGLQRTRAIVRARADYDLVRMTDAFDLDVAWEHRTVRTVPANEGYRLAMLPPKLLLLGALKVPLEGEHRWWELEQASGLYPPLPRPASVHTWDDDLWFGAQRIQGPHPLPLRGLGDASALAALGLSVDVPIDPARLYVADHREALRGCTPAPGRFLPPCAALFESTERGLLPVLIEVERPEGPPVVFRPGQGDGWRLGRLYFGAADMLVHEVVAHYQWTHVLGETFAIVTARNLPWQHPVRGLLAPHLRSTLQQNRNAAGILVADGGLFDRCFAGGDCKHRLLEWGAKNWSYDRMILPRAVARQGLEGLEDVPWRDDAMLLWRALERYVYGFVGAWYTEERLRADHELRSWSQELSDALGVPGVGDLDGLVELLTGIVFNPVAHNLVNALQYDTFGFPLGSPVALHLPVPADPALVDEPMLLRALPRTGDTLQTVRATYGFTLQYDRLGAHLDPPLPPDAPPLGQDLRAALQAAEETIVSRNHARRFAYHAARPSRVGNSVDA